MNNPNYSDYLQIKECDKKGKEFRKKLLDLVKYARKADKGYIFSAREIQERFVEYTSQGHGSFSVSDILHRVNFLGLDPAKVHFEVHTGEDFEGYPEFTLQLYVMTPETDSEYFNRLGEIISPSKHQIKQAILDRKEQEEYLRLKAKFEGKGV